METKNPLSDDIRVHHGHRDVLGDITHTRESLSLFKHLTKSYETMLELERERNDRLLAIIEKLTGLTDEKDKTSPEK